MKTQYAPLLALLIATTATADIYQYEDCDGNGTLLLTELDAEPGVDLSELYLGCADLYGATLPNANLHYANLHYANLGNADLSYADLNDATLTNTYLVDADLSGADLTNADLSGALMGRANLSGTLLSGADLTSANLNHAMLYAANLTNANLFGADLSSANLVAADLTGANLANADLSYADLNGADLTGANLANADLSYADLNGADLTGAQSWQSADWHGATYNDATIFPEGMNPEKFGMIYDDTVDVTEGACCVTSGCDVVEETMCTNFGGTWTEAGSCDDCVTPPETCDADLDNNGEVNIDDLLLLIGAWGVCP